MNPTILSSEQKEEIRANYTGRYGELVELATKYGVSKSTIIRILNSDYADKEREQRKKYMSEVYDHKYPRQIIFQMRIDPIKEPDLFAKISEIEKGGLVSSRQQYVKDLIRKDIHDSQNKK
ncbi:MAG: hypothetical protein IJZ42_01575 [Lachnospiraceae bacterium]|nr:hypothetical protein [Lachnospiraceae bacterium]